jgi:hypothetical protein
MALFHSLTHSCRYTALGFDFPCQPPWHFCWWAPEAQAPAMQHATRVTGVQVRLGERVQQWDGETRIEVWAHEAVVDLTAWWQAVAAYGETEKKAVGSRN